MDTQQKIAHVEAMIRVVKNAIATYRQRGRKVNEGYERERLAQLERELAELKGGESVG